MSARASSTWLSRIGRDDMHPHETAKLAGSLRQRLTGHDQVEAEIVEFLEHILDRPLRDQLQSQPRKAIAGLRRAGGQTVQRLRQCALAIGDGGLRYGAKRQPLHALETHRERRDPRQYLRAQQPGEPAVRHHHPERPVGRLQQAPRHRQALVLIGVEQCGVGLSLHHQRQLPRQIVGVLQAGVHALRADRAVDVGGVAEQEAAAVAEALGAAVMDAVGGKPRARS